ncbi:hypothetical protein PG993_004111 [Apiospora rasikravindrae]|uniref:Uncharacterized protein n=1 Tax=Apiospora rasikravindrae TaxID=990691 RepID=A0ABR1TBU1_9PEZI
MPPWTARWLSRDVDYVNQKSSTIEPPIAGLSGELPSIARRQLPIGRRNNPELLFLSIERRPTTRTRIPQFSPEVQSVIMPQDMPPSGASARFSTRWVALFSIPDSFAWTDNGGGSGNDYSGRRNDLTIRSPDFGSDIPWVISERRETGVRLQLRRDDR